MKGDINISFRLSSTKTIQLISTIYNQENYFQTISEIYTPEKYTGCKLAQWEQKKLRFANFEQNVQTNQSRTS